MSRIDIDALFENYMRERVSKNEEKLTLEEWENKIPELYEDFSKVPFAELGGKTPAEVYAGRSGANLAAELCETLEEGAEPSEFLCRALAEAEDAEEPLIALLDEEEEEKVMYALNLLGERGSAKAVPKYIGLVLFGADGHVKELAAELLSERSEDAKEGVLSAYADADEDAKALFCDVLSRCRADGRVFAVLKDAFLSHPDKAAMYSSYLARYGDESALPLLYEAIERPGLDFAEFRELKFAIETLGGEYEKKRDFSADKTYKKIREQSAKDRNKTGKQQ